MTTDALADVITAITRAAGLDDDVSSHILRHTFRHRTHPQRRRHRDGRRAHGPCLARNDPALHPAQRRRHAEGRRPALCRRVDRRPRAGGARRSGFCRKPPPATIPRGGSECFHFHVLARCAPRSWPVLRAAVMARTVGGRQNNRLTEAALSETRVSGLARVQGPCRDPERHRHCLGLCRGEITPPGHATARSAGSAGSGPKVPHQDMTARGRRPGILADRVLSSSRRRIALDGSTPSSSHSSRRHL